jgi:hypothetical protein
MGLKKIGTGEVHSVGHTKSSERVRRSLLRHSLKAGLLARS